jgi:hypothetical protein
LKPVNITLPILDAPAQEPAGSSERGGSTGTIIAQLATLGRGVAIRAVIKYINGRWVIGIETQAQIRLGLQS